MQTLSDSNHRVKCKCLRLLSDLLPTDERPEAASGLLSTLSDFSNNQDPRVRTEAFCAMVRLPSLKVLPRFLPPSLAWMWQVQLLLVQLGSGFAS